MAINYGRAAVGVGVGYVAYRIFRSAFSDANAAVDKLQAARCPGNDPKCRIVPAGQNIEQRARYIGEMVWRSSLDPQIRKLAYQTLSRKCDGAFCTPPREHMQEVKALANAIYDPDSEMWSAVEGHFAFIKGDSEHAPSYRYTKDNAIVDVFSSAKRTLESGGGDCDDATILVDALNLASGFPVGERIYQTKDANDWSHIAGLVEIPPHSGKWYVMDASVDKVREGGKVKAVYPGWQAPRHMITKWVDFAITPGGGVQKIGSGP